MGDELIKMGRGLGSLLRLWGNHWPYPLLEREEMRGHASLLGDRRKAWAFSPPETGEAM